MEFFYNERLNWLFGKEYATQFDDSILALETTSITALFPRELFEISNTDLNASILNLLNPTGHVMHQQFNIQQLYVLPKLYYVFCIYLRANSDLCHLHHKLIGFYNRD